MAYLKNSNGFSGKRDFGARPSFGARDEKHKAVCDACGATCEVPFIPNGKKPVYCRNCYKDNATTTSFTGQPFTRGGETSRDDDSSDLKKQFSILNTKLDRLTSAIEAQTRALTSNT